MITNMGELCRHTKTKIKALGFLELHDCYLNAYGGMRHYNKRLRRRMGLGA